jgi:RNA polymerase sigma-70 factor (ECF subfamily)
MDVMLKSEVIPISADCSREAAALPDALQDNLDGLYRFALRLSRNTDEAQELVQEAALRAWERRDTMVRNWRAWLFQTLYHAFISRKRRSKRWGEDEAADAEIAEYGSPHDPLPALVAVEDVRRAIESLPENLRVVVWLSDAENFRLREIATILDCPIGTVASRLARARDALRIHLSAYGSRKLRES